VPKDIYERVKQLNDTYKTEANQLDE
jgi:hypothetical protein